MMENVIEKHYVPTSGSGLDANLVAALMNNNNKSLDPATVALLRDNDKGLETAALANGGGMFGGGTPVSNPNNESPATLQRKLIVLAFNLPDNIVTTSPIEDQITVTVDSVDTATFTNPDGTTNTDYLVIVKVVQNLSYCTRSLVGYREVTRTKTTYECFIMPQEEGASAPQISATYDYDVFINHCNYVVPNIARTRNHAIVVSIRNSASA